MKKLLCCVIGIALLLSLFTGCGGKPAQITEGGSDGLSGFLSGSSNEEYMLTEDAELDMTGFSISSDRTLLLQEGVTLKLIGTFTPGESCITVRAGYDNDGESTLDLSGLSLTDIEPQEATLFEIRSDVKLIPPTATETLLVDTANDEWTSIKSALPQEEPPEEDTQQAGPQNDDAVSTPEEFLQAFGDSKVSKIELNNDIAVEFEAASLTRDLIITCNSHVLTLSGKLNMNGGTLDIGEKPGAESGTVDLSGLTVTCGFSDYTRDIIFIGLDFKHIIGEATLGEGMHYEIPDSGEHTSIKPDEVITPEMHEAKLQEELTQYLSGVEFQGGVDISAEFLADGVLEINLDNPVVDQEIGVGISGGMTLILTGSVTFDGGNYGFHLREDHEGTAKVDITGLEINGTKALGKTKSPDIFMTRDGVELIFDESNPHIEVVVNDRFWLRYVQ